MRRLRYWSTNNASLMNRLYQATEKLLVKLLPWFEKIGLERVEPVLALLEKTIKVPLFDCKMCGNCVLSSTGMACPMNCPKTLRNGPCGGVRSNGHCEVEPDMRCVWVEATRGARLMQATDALKLVQAPIEFHRQGRSSWLLEAQKQREAQADECRRTMRT